MVHALFKTLAFRRAENSFSGDLLPPRAGFVILHEEVLIINPRKMELRVASCTGRLPHQTGVAERSVSDKHRDAANHVLHYVVISNLAHRVSGGIAVHFDSQYHVTVRDKAGIIYFCEGGVRERLEHPFEMILARQPSCQGKWDKQSKKEAFEPPAAGLIPEGNSDHRR